MKWSESKRYRRLTYVVSFFTPIVLLVITDKVKHLVREFRNGRLFDDAEFLLVVSGIILSAFLILRFLPRIIEWIIESGRIHFPNFSNHQGYKRLSIFVPCVVFVMVWINLKIEEGHIDAGDFAWISGVSALFAALSFVAVKGIHFVTDGFKLGTVEKPETKRREPDVSEIESSEKLEMKKTEPEVSKSEASAIAIPEKEKGWKPLPTSLKVLFVYGSLSLVLAAFSIEGILEIGGASILGFYIPGVGAALTFIIFSLVGSIVLLLAIWNRSTWTWKYGCAYFSFFTLNALLGLRNLSEVLDARLASEPLAAEPGFSGVMYLSAVMGTLFASALNVVFVIFLFRKRTYFK